jgi:hypothetical protein
MRALPARLPPFEAILNKSAERPSKFLYTLWMLNNPPRRGPLRTH